MTRLEGVENPPDVGEDPEDADGDNVDLSAMYMVRVNTGNEFHRLFFFFFLLSFSNAQL